MDLFIATRRRGVHENDSLALDRTSFKMSIAMVTGSDVSRLYSRGTLEVFLKYHDRRRVLAKACDKSRNAAISQVCLEINGILLDLGPSDLI